MDTLYFDCSMGAAGDMLTGALMELLPDPADFLRRLNGLGLPGVQVTAERGENGGMAGTQVTVSINGAVEEEPAHDPLPAHGHDHDHDHGHGHDHDHHHHHGHDHGHVHAHLHAHATLQEITALVAGLAVPDGVRRRILAVYRRIAQAESEAHGVTVEQVHFHEVGAMDALADVTAVCLLMDALSPARVVVSPICVGSGHVRCAHGLLPVPAPATARLLRGAPIYGSDFPGELCTPTGAALLMEFATEFGPLPAMTLCAAGCGLGRKTFPRANCLRALAGTRGPGRDTVLELICTVDDMTAEQMAFAMERLFDAGALDVSTQAVGMKKSRLGTQLRVLCREAQREALVEALFRHTTTLGVRELETRRYVLTRRVETVETAFGPVRRKISDGYGVTRSKWEYEDLARIARETGRGIWEVESALEGAQ